MSGVENVEKSGVDEGGRGRAVPASSTAEQTASQDDEYAAMRQAVAREYADALGKRYEPPSEEPDTRDQPRFDKVEIDSRKISEYVMNAEHPHGQHKSRVINSATGLTAQDADQIESQIRAGVRNGTAVVGKHDQFGSRWNVDVPVTGPAGTMTVRTAWIVEPGGDRPRLVTVSFPPTGS